MNKDNHTPSFHVWRFYLLLCLLSLVVLGLTWRVFNLAILDQHFLKQRGDERVLRLVSTPAFRGMIVDRNGFPLAVSTTVYSAWMNPQEFIITPANVKKLAMVLHMQPREIILLAREQGKKKREFVYLKRSLSPEVATQIKVLNLPGIYLQQAYRRYYPEGEVAAHVIGFTNVDDQGQEGLELAYNAWLQGEPGKKWVIKDRLGRVISEMQTVQEQKAGNDLVLSIDRRIQYLAYRELLRAILQNRADSGSVVVLDAKTGEVLAMVNYPAFNPNNRPAHRGDHFRNRAVTDTFEPGSTIKAFTVASALESRRYQPNSVIDTSPGWMRVGQNVVRDEKNNGVLSMAQILQISSNMGAAKIILTLPPNLLWSLLRRMGFGEVTGISFPGEQSGSLTRHHPWGAFTLATMSFGYGLSATLLQLTRAYAVLANGGIKKNLSLVRVTKEPDGERVLDAHVAKQMLNLLETVVAKGTGSAAQVAGYRIAGKTGTAWVVGKHGYEKNNVSSSFIGIAPLSHPRLVVAVVIHHARGKNHLGGVVSGPVFAKVMEGTLRMLAVPPDDRS